MKKILYIVNVDWFFVSHRLPIAIKALESGYQVTIACRFTQHKEQLCKMGFNVIEIPFDRSGGSLLSELKVLIEIKRAVDFVQPSIIHSVTIKPVIYSGLVLKLVGRNVPLVAAISGLGYVFAASSLRAKFTKVLVSFLYKIALSQTKKIVIFQNSSDEKILSEIASLTPLNKELIKGSGADLKVYKHSPERAHGHIKIVMASRLLKEKGVYQYVEAAQIVKQRNPSAEFLLVGSPDLDNPNSVQKEEIEIWVRQKIVTFLGHRNDISDIFSSSNIVCLPSFYGEGVPKVLIEAAACGRPIITTDNPGCKDAVIEGQTGLTVPTRDAEALANAISHLIDNPELRVSMGYNARAFAEAEFNVDSVVDKHLEIYRKMLG